MKVRGRRILQLAFFVAISQILIGCASPITALFNATQHEITCARQYTTITPMRGFNQITSAGFNHNLAQFQLDDFRLSIKAYGTVEVVTAQGDFAQGFAFNDDFEGTIDLSAFESGEIEIKFHLEQARGYTITFSFPRTEYNCVGRGASPDACRCDPCDC